MWDILKIMTGVFLGEFLWGIVLFTFLYILIRKIVRRAKNRLLETSMHISFTGLNPHININPSRLKGFLRYSGNAVSSTINHVRK